MVLETEFLKSVSNSEWIRLLSFMLFKLGIMTTYLENEADEPSIPAMEKQTDLLL